MDDSMLIQVSVDEAHYAELQREAMRLGVTVEDIVGRATRAWIGEMEEAAPDSHEV